MKDRTTPTKLTPAMIAKIREMFVEKKASEEIAETISQMTGSKCYGHVNTMRRNGQSIPSNSRR